MVAEIDRVDALHQVERLMRALRKAGVRPPTRAAKALMRRLLGEDIAVTTGGLRFAGSVSLHRGYLWSLRAGMQEPFMVKLFSEAIEPGMAVSDVGAFLGYYACIAARATGEAGKVYALEPDPRNFHYLQRNVAQNGLQDQVKAWPLAASNVAGNVTFSLHHYDPSQTSQWAVDPRGQQATVACAALADIIPADERPPDIVKIDVEGGEREVLAGFKDRVRPRMLFIEYNPAALHAAGHPPQQLFADLVGRGYGISLIDEKTRRLEPLNSPPTGLRWANLLCQWVS